jgi:hypothetical protein
MRFRREGVSRIIKNTCLWGAPDGPSLGAWNEYHQKEIEDFLNFTVRRRRRKK